MEKRKKIIVKALIALVIAIIAILFLLFARSLKTKEIVLKDGLILSKDICSKLEEVTFISLQGCSACAIALPILQQIENEIKDMNINFGYYDMIIEKDKKKILGLKLIPEAVPVVIVHCKVFVGVRNKEFYKNEIIEGE